MNTSRHITRYREYLRSFGIAEAGDRVAELGDLDLGNIRFFAYYSSDGLRLKAAVTPIGVVTPGLHTADDWHGFLSGMPDAAAAAERIAWLETDASKALHGLRNASVAALIPSRPLQVGIDPAHWAIVTPPMLFRNPDGSITLIMWTLPSGTRIPERWILKARSREPAVIECIRAIELLETNASSAEALEEDATSRAMKLLTMGTDDARWWALQHIGESGDRAAVPGVAAVLANADTGPNIRVLAAGTLARLSDPVAVASLGAALRMDSAPEVRRACAQALGRVGGTQVVQLLMAAAAEEPDQIVRLEIVHALEAQGNTALAALNKIAKDDPDAEVRNLARGSVDAIN